MISTSFSSFASKGISSLNSSLKNLSDSYAKLSSGLRINRAADDAAGLAISSNLLNGARLDSQALSNIGDAQSALNIADGATQQISDINTRRAELAMQASNGTYSDAQRSVMQQEFDQLGQEMQRIAQTTEFNGTKLLDGQAISVQVGTDSSSNSSINVGGLSVTSSLSQGGSLDISTQAGAQAALGAVQDFSQTLNTQRAESIGAAQSRLNSASSVVSESRLAKMDAGSRIVDANIAEVAASLSKQQVQAKASVAMIAQAKNLDGATVSMLLG